MAEVSLDFSTLRGDKPRILITERYDNHPHHFYMGVPLPLPPPPPHCPKETFPLQTLSMLKGFLPNV